MENNEHRKLITLSFSSDGLIDPLNNVSLSLSLPRMEDIAPSFIRKLRNCTVIEGQRARFDCFIAGEPTPSIRWLINGVAIDIDTNRQKYSSDVQTNGKVTLTIEDCTQKDAGEISIIVENRAGSTQCSAELTVERMFR